MGKHKKYNYFRYKDAVGDGKLLQKTVIERLGISRGTQQVWEKRHEEMKDIVMQEVQTILLTIPSHGLNTDKIKEILRYD